MDRLSFLLILLTLLGCNKPNEMRPEGNDAIGFNNLSSEQFRKGNYDSALFFIDKAIGIDSSYYLGQYQRLTILWNLNRNKEALHVAKKISELRNYSNVSIEGMAYERLGDLSKAKELYKVTVDSWPKDDLASNYQARLEYSQLGTVVYGKEFGLQEIAKIDTLKLNDGEIEIVETMRRTIERYEGNSYRDLIENINILPTTGGL
jgi:tetratricopeptide (TPR) repeat protein